MPPPANPRRRPLVAASCLLLLAAVPLPAQTPAADRYRQLLAANPTEGVALDRLWQGAEERGTTAALLEDYRRAAEGNGPGAFNAALVHGHLLKKAANPDAAAAAYRRAATLDPASPLPPLALAGLFTARGEPVRAAESLGEALTKIPSADVRRRVDVLLQLGAARQAGGELANAAAAWEQAVALAPNDLALRERLAGAGEAAGDFGRAATQWEFIESHAAAPEARAQAARALGRVRAAAGEFEPAREAFFRGLALVGPGNWLRAEFQRALIALHARAGRLPELETRWRTEADRAPRDPGARLQLAEFYRQTGDRAGERAALESVVTLLPRTKEPALRLARLLADADDDPADLPRAVGLLDGLLKAQPGNFDLLVARAELDLRAGRPEEAAARVEAAVRARPEDDTLRTAALTFFNAHRLFPAAERVLRDAAGRRPDAEEPAFALAAFLFQQRQPDAARAVLDGSLTRAPGDAARLGRAADLCRLQNAPADALRFARRAAEAAPADAGRRLALAEAELAVGETDAARADFLRAAEGAADPEETERRLFATFQPPPGANAETVRQTDAAAGEFNRTLETAVHENRPGAAGRLTRWLLFRHQSREALEVARAATVTEPESRPLRELLARAATEAGDRPLAIRTLEQLLAEDLTPADRARRQRTLATLRQEEGDTDGALALLTELAVATPSRESLTDLALAQQRADRWYDALATWERLLALPGLPPGARAEARRPLVAVLSRLGQHERALDLLDGALDAATGDVRAGLFREALALATDHGLLPRLAGRAEGRVATARPGDAAPLTELAAVRRQQGRERDADDLLERAALAAPDPTTALGPLSALVDAAERRGDPDTAVARQERLVALAGPDAGAEAVARLAELRATVGDPAGAARAWNTLAARFPRDPAGLTRAAAFFEGPGGDDAARARELLARVVALDPGDVARQLRLGNLAAAAGDLPTARGAFNAILERTPPEAPGEPVEPPDIPLPIVSGLASPAGGVVREERRQRLAAIRGLAGLPMSPEERGRFLDGWRKQAASTPGEALWAGHFGNAPDLALDVLAGVIAVNKPPDERLPRLFVALALRAGDAGRLGRFLRPPGATEGLLRRRRDLMLEGLRAFLPTVRDRERPLSEATLAALFPEPGTSRETLWRAAAGIFATNSRYPEAVALGERALARSRSGRAVLAVALARWQLWCGRPDAARADLRAVLEDPGTPALPSVLAGALWGTDGDDDEETGSGEGSDAGLEAVRLLHALLPAGERAAFRATVEARSGALSPARAAETRALLAGLAGDGKTARAAMARLVALRPTLGGTTSGLSAILSGNPASGSETDARRWGYLLGTFRRFADAGLDDVALALGVEALADPGLVGLQGANQREGPLRELREAVTNLRFRAAGGDPGREAAIGEEFLRSGPTVRSVVNVVNTLLGAGMPATAERFAAAAGPRLPTDRTAGETLSDLRRARLRALTASGDAGKAETLLRAALPDAAAPPPVAAGPGPVPLWTETALPLADVLEKAGDLPAVVRLLANAPTRPSGPWSVVATRLAACQEKLGQIEPAADTLRAVLRVNPTLPPARMTLVELEDRLGHPDRATAVLEEAVPPGPTPPAPPLALALARRDLLAGHPERPVELARRFVRAGQHPSAIALAELFAGENVPPTLRPVGRRLLAAAVHAARDGQMRFAAQRSLVEKFCDPATDRADFERELHRLGHVAQGTPGLRSVWQTVRYDLLAGRPEHVASLEATLRQEDDAASDARLVRLGLRDREHPAADLPARVERLLRRERLDVATLEATVRALDGGGRGDLAVPLANRLAGLLPQNGELGLLAARVRWQAGDHDGATAALAAREELGVFDRDEPLGVATAWVGLGEPDRARDVLERAVERQAGPRTASRARMALAGLELARGNLASAAPVLRGALADPGVTDLGPALDYLAARGTLADPAAWGDIATTVGARARLLPAAFDRLADGGRWEDARALAAARPTLLVDYAPAAARLRAHAEDSGNDAERTAVESLFSQTISQASDPAPPRLAHELARLLAAMARTLSPGDPQRLVYLNRATALEPSDGALARLAAEECTTRNDPAGATTVWRRLLAAPDALPADREEARRRTSAR